MRSDWENAARMLRARVEEIRATVLREAETGKEYEAIVADAATRLQNDLKLIESVMKVPGHVAVMAMLLMVENRV